MVREGKQMRREHSQKWQERWCHMFRKQVMALSSTSYTAGGTQPELTQPLGGEAITKELNLQLRLVHLCILLVHAATSMVLVGHEKQLPATLQNVSAQNGLKPSWPNSFLSSKHIILTPASGNTTLPSLTFST